jgi:hypothetical protein
MMRTLTVICFTVYIIFAIIGCQRVQIQMREEHFLQSNSTSAQYLQKYRHSFKKYEHYIELTFDSNVDYYDKDQRGLILDLLTAPVREQQATKAVCKTLFNKPPH